MTRPYWKAIDFWIAIVVAIAFWLTFTLFIPYEQTVSTDTALQLLLLILVFPILEEIVFRGLIQESIQKLLSHNNIKTMLFWRISYANLLTSLLFSALHLWSQPVLWALGVILPSLIFGYFKDRYQSLKPSILLHIFYNSGFYWFF